MPRRLQVMFVAIVWTSAVLVFNEYLIYYLSMWPCSFPHVVGSSENDVAAEVRAMILADPHLLGEKRGAWIDRTRREWQMERTFQTAQSLLEPDVIFILGDVTDEGQDASTEDFERTFERYKRMFRRSGDTPLLLVPGNHDIGFHNAISESGVERFDKLYDTKSVRVISILNLPFVLLNSVGLKSDDCFLCSAMRQKMKESAMALRHCAPDVSEETCLSQPVSGKRPILLQHYPLYRSSDLLCHGDDLDPSVGHQAEFRENWEVISKDATETVLSHFQPRLAFSGHTHHGCNVMHHLGTPFPTEEQTVASFSWRNRNSPNFILLTASENDYSFDKCYAPSETVVLAIYILALGIPLVYLVWPLVMRRYNSKKRVSDFWSKVSWVEQDNSRWKSWKGT